MKGKRRLKKIGFQPSNSFSKGITRKKVTDEPLPYRRLTADQYQSLVSENADGTINLLDVDGNQAPIRLLRKPKPKLSETPKASSVADSSTGEVYKIHHQGKLQTFLNKCFKEHQQKSPTCDGNIEFDRQAEEKRGLCWKEQTKCTKCSYKSSKDKLYTEVERTGPGCRAAVPNVGIHVGLSQSMISSTACRRILMAAHIPAPAKSSMQATSNAVHKKIIDANESDMAARRKKLHDYNEVMGLPRDTPIRVEADGRYNNSLQSGSGKTPFQAGTQAVYTVAENQTTEKQIIAVSIKNKLCTKAQKLRNLGKKITCPNHPGTCTATAPLNASIGNEGEMAAKCVKKLAGDKEPTVIKYTTLDGDSCAYQGFTEQYKEGHSNVRPQLLKDTRHLSLGQKCALAKISWSPEMFPEMTKAQREKLARRLNEDVKRQCTRTFDLCYKACAGDTNLMIKKLSDAVEAMVEYYSDSEVLCRKGKSFTCSGRRRGRWDKPMLPNGYKLNMSDADKASLHECINYKLGRQAVLAQRFNTNSQKAEAVNRSYTSTNPKCVTMTRNFEGRIHAAVHKVNNGPGKSTALLLDAVGAGLSSSLMIMRQLQSEDVKVQYIKDHHKSVTRRSNRVKTVLRNFKTYDNKPQGQEPTYKKGMYDRLPRSNEQFSFLY